MPVIGYPRLHSSNLLIYFTLYAHGLGFIDKKWHWHIEWPQTWQRFSLWCAWFFCIWEKSRPITGWEGLYVKVKQRRKEEGLFQHCFHLTFTGDCSKKWLLQPGLYYRQITFEDYSCYETITTENINRCSRWTDPKIKCSSSSWNVTNVIQLKGRHLFFCFDSNLHLISESLGIVF